MSVAKLFAHGGSQAVRLPKDFRFEGSEARVRRVGDEVVPSPRPPVAIESLVEAGPGFEPGSRLERETVDADRRAELCPRR